MPIKDLSGHKFGRLTVLYDYARTSQLNVIWLCKCECGKELPVVSSYLLTGTTRSCGCLKKEESLKRFTTHGMTNTRLYKIWASMNQRCNDKNCKSYNAYGGKGVTVFHEWNSFQSFNKWALKNGYDDTLTIDRIDCEGNYSPENCQFIPFTENRRKHRDSIMLNHSGVLNPLKTWCDILGLPTSTVRRFYHKNGKNVTERNLSLCIESGRMDVFNTRRK